MLAPLLTATLTAAPDAAPAVTAMDVFLPLGIRAAVVYALSYIILRMEWMKRIMRTFIAQMRAVPDGGNWQQAWRCMLLSFTKTPNRVALLMVVVLAVGNPLFLAGTIAAALVFQHTRVIGFRGFESYIVMGVFILAGWFVLAWLLQGMAG